MNKKEQNPHRPIDKCWTTLPTSFMTPERTLTHFHMMIDPSLGPLVESRSFPYQEQSRPAQSSISQYEQSAQFLRSFRLIRLLQSFWQQRTAWISPNDASDLHALYQMHQCVGEPADKLVFSTGDTYKQDRESSAAEQHTQTPDPRKSLNHSLTHYGRCAIRDSS